MRVWFKRKLVSVSGEAPWPKDCIVGYIMLIALILLCAVAYTSRVTKVVRQSDPAAYYFASTSIAKAGLAQFCDDNNVLVGPYFTLLGFKVKLHDDDPCFHPNLNIGLPLLVAPFSEAAFYLPSVLGLIGLIALFALGQALFDWATGILAAGLLAFNFWYWWGATEMWTDVPATAFLLVGTWFVVRMVDRDDWRQGMLGGVALGYAGLIRYPSLAALLPLGLYLWFATRGRARPKRALTGLGLGLGLLALVILACNQSNYGGFLRTGYSAQRGEVPWPRFSLTYFYDQSPIGKGGYRVILSTLLEGFNIAGLFLSLVAMVIMPRTKAILVGSFAITFCLLYAFYAWPARGVNTRFLLPVFPMICLSIAFSVNRLLRLLLGQKNIVLAVMLSLVIWFWHSPSIHTSLLSLERRNRYVETGVALVREFTGATESNAVFLSRQYHDWIILYGRRSALLYSMIATPDPVSQSYQVSNYAPKLVEVVNKLLEHNIPVYVVVEPEEDSPIQDPIDPFPILSVHFNMVPFRTKDPVIYRALIPQVSQTQ